MNKKVNTIIILSFLFILILGGSYAYSKYKSEVSGNASASVAKWNISVNGCNIVDKDKETENCFDTTVDEESGIVTINKNFNIGNIKYNSNDNPNIVDNKIGPGSSGYFDINIKPNDTGVSIKYKLKINLNVINDSLKIYRSNPNTEEKIPLEEEGFEKIIKYSENNKNYSEVIRIYVDWENDPNGKNDKVDTEIGTSDSIPVLDIPVLIEFEQFKG